MAARSAFFSNASCAGSIAQKLTLYSSNTNPDLLAETGVATRSRCVRCRRRSTTSTRSCALSTLLPKELEILEIGHHDIYHSHLWPTHLIDRHPMVWSPHEPLRILYDLLHSLRLNRRRIQIERFLHFYLPQNHDKVSQDYYDAALRTIYAFDTTGRPDRIVANSRYTARYLEAVYGIPIKDAGDLWVTIHTSPDVASSRSFVLSVGQLWRHKRVRLAVEAIRHVDDVDLYIVGSGPEYRKLPCDCRSDRRRGSCLFRFGPEQSAHSGLLYKRCLCCIFVPVREPFGIVAIETLTAAQPLIAVNEGGFTEIVDDKCAFLVAAEPATIAGRIKQLQSDPKVARKMGTARPQDRARQRSWDRTARSPAHHQGLSRDVACQSGRS